MSKLRYEIKIVREGTFIREKKRAVGIMTAEGDSPTTNTDIHDIAFAVGNRNKRLERWKRGMN